MNFGQLTGNHMRNIFLEKPYTRYVAETTPRPFFEKFKIEHISVSIA